MGIEYNGNSGRSLAYWVQSKVQGRSESRRIPADQMLHIYDVLYPGQRRGLPWMFAVLGKFFQMDELLDAELIGSKIAACFSVFFTGPTSNQTQVTEGGNAKDANGNILSHIQPGLMSWLPEGTDVSFAQPQKPGATFGQFMELLERKVGSGTHAGMSYEALTRDTSKTNFAGIRASQQMDFQAWRPIQKWLARKYCRPTWDKVIDLGVMTGALDAPGYDNPLIGSSFWQVHEWVPSGWHFGVNPAQEVAASRDAIRAGLTNLAHESGLLGIDWRTNLRMTARVQKMSEDLGLVLTSDAAYSTVNGVESEAVPLAKVESAADKTAGGSADA